MRHVASVYCMVYACRMISRLELENKMLTQENENMRNGLAVSGRSVTRLLIQSFMHLLMCSLTGDFDCCSQLLQKLTDNAVKESNFNGPSHFLSKQFNSMYIKILTSSRKYPFFHIQITLTMKDWCAAGSCSEEKDKELQVGINAHLFITNVLRHCGWRLFHGNKCQDLEQMILHHVSETANSCLLYWAKEMAPWPTEDKLHPSPAYVNYPMYIVLQLIVSPDPKTSSIPFSSLHYHPIPNPTVYPSLAYIISQITN